jgi:hypothetical protein
VGALSRIATPGTGPNRLLRVALVVMWVGLLVYALVGTVLLAPRFAVDLEIPLRAAERWIAGLPPYQPEAFVAEPGATQPFLYPPYLLPFLAALTSLPRELVSIVWVGLLGLAAVLACRRLAIPWTWLPLVLAWPPFAEGIYGGNVQVLLFAAFVFLFWSPPVRGWREPRDIGDPRISPAVSGGLATAIGAVKVSQLQPWVYVLRQRPSAALGGLAVVALVVAATLPLTGIDLWFEWVAQLRRASDPSWDLGGIAVTRFLPGLPGLAIVAACLIAAWFVPRRTAGEWIGILSTVGAASLHIFGMLSLGPALLVIRLELALLSVMAITTYSYLGSWVGIGIAALAFAAGTRWPGFYEPPPRARA